MWRTADINEALGKQVRAAVESRRTRLAYAENACLDQDVCAGYRSTIENLESLVPGCSVRATCRLQGEESREMVGTLVHDNGIFIAGDALSMEVEGIPHPVDVPLENILEVM